MLAHSICKSKHYIKFKQRVCVVVVETSQVGLTGDVINSFFSPCNIGVFPVMFVVILLRVVAIYFPLTLLYILKYIFRRNSLCVGVNDKFSPTLKSRQLYNLCTVCCLVQ